MLVFWRHDILLCNFSERLRPRTPEDENDSDTGWCFNMNFTAPPLWSIGKCVQLKCGRSWFPWLGQTKDIKVLLC